MDEPSEVGEAKANFSGSDVEAVEGGELVEQGPEGGPNQPGPSRDGPEPPAPRGSGEPYSSPVGQEVEDAQAHEIRCGPRGPDWQEDPAVLPCPCGLSVQRTRFARHVRECSMQPCPIARIKGSFGDVITLVRAGSDRRVSCFCGKPIKASDRDVSVANALARHFSSHHRGMTAGERIDKRRAIFAQNNVLVGQNVQTAMRAGNPLHPSAYDDVEAEQRRHGSSLAQATAASAKESREEHLLRSSLLLHPQPMALFSVDATFKEVCEPSESTMNALHSFERALDVEFIDWRQLVAVTENRRKMRRDMRDRYNVSAASGALTTNAVRMFLDFIKGHLAEMTDGQDWQPPLDMTGDMVTSLVKECRHLLTKAQGKTQAKHQAEERLDHPTRKRIEREVLKTLEFQNVQIAMRAGIPLHPSAYDDVEAEQRRHSSSLAQATAASAKESREEHLLRSSLLLHPQPMALFSVDATFKEVCEPSKSTMNALHSFERALDVEFIDWRQLVAVTENRRKMRRVMRDRYNVSAASGALTTNAVTMFLNFIKGHLVEMTDGQDWQPLLDMKGDMVTSLVKECRHLLTKAHGKTQAKHQAEERLDHPTRKRIEREVLKTLESRVSDPLLDSAKERLSRGRLVAASDLCGYESAGISSTVQALGAAMNSIAVLAATYGAYASEPGLVSADAIERLEAAAKVVEDTARDTTTLSRLIEAVREYQGKDAVKQLVFSLSVLDPQRPRFMKLADVVQAWIMTRLPNFGVTSYVILSVNEIPQNVPQLDACFNRHPFRSRPVDMRTMTGEVFMRQHDVAPLLQAGVVIDVRLSYTLDIHSGAMRLSEAVKSANDGLPFKDDPTHGLQFKHFRVAALLKGVETNADRLHQLLLPHNGGTQH
ncbi:hypothetical protein FJT64_008814 [Amphibalanus amphitrite]|uniref:Uncharacterized protein n=1 Tax=Amphibalanus amphitrite TaxID=1232801 RepID=A0A6A4VFS0_AMPAM|nr:hypothetical protein FJT64_008814 [Amphibalanus amphitrite]